MPLEATYDPLLVALSIAVAIVASYVALDTAGRVRGARGRLRLGWMIGGAFAMGVGIWSMHFIGMLAFHLPVPMRYDLSLVVLSVVVAIFASGLAMVVVSRASVSLVLLGLASILMGSAICGMHYIGMAAMRLPAVFTYTAPLVLTSIAIAIVASFVALLLSFRLRDQQVHLWRRPKAVGALVMGLAIAGMHYTAMAAAVFSPSAGAGRMPHGLSPEHDLWWGVIAGTVFVLAIALTSAAVDARLHREEILRQTAETAQAAAEDANRAKDQFLALLSHELRTPLNVVLGWTHVLSARDDVNDEVRRGLDIVERNARTQLRLVDELLDLQRLVLGQLSFEQRPVELSALVAGALEDYRPVATERGVTLVSTTVPAIVRGDAGRLRQAVHNLLSNATKFTSSGGIVRVEIAVSDGTARLVVSDDGEGMPPEFVPHAFDPFRQAEHTRTRRHGGLGLGLSIVRHVVEHHGGRVTAVSDGIGRGASLTIELPLAQDVPILQDTTDAA
jgi:signal transduction histidine kinase